MLIAIAVTVTNLVLGSMAGYAFARLRFPLRTGLFLLVLNGVMLWLTSAVSDALGLGFHVADFTAAFLGALVVSLVSFLLSLFVSSEKHRSTT